MRKRTVPAISVIFALAVMWWWCWFLRAGANGPNGWAYLPICFTCLIFGGGGAIFLIYSSEQR